MVDELGRILERRQTPTPSHSPEAVEDAIVDMVTELSRDRSDVSSVGIGAAGWVDNTQAVVAFSPHLAWRNEPLKEKLSRRIDLPLIVDNDANAARVGGVPLRRRARQLSDGMSDPGDRHRWRLGDRRVSCSRGTYGMAGEWGHIRRAGGSSVRVRQPGLLGAVRLRQRPGARGSGSGPRQFTAGPQDGGAAGRRPGQDHWPGLVTAAALQGESTAIELIGEVGGWLGVGIANLAATLDPDLFVIGGGVSEAGSLLLEPTRQAFARTLTGRGFRTPARIELAHLRNDAGLIGAADLARHAIAHPPLTSQSGFWPGLEPRDADSEH